MWVITRECVRSCDLWNTACHRVGKYSTRILSRQRLSGHRSRASKKAVAIINRLGPMGVCTNYSQQLLPGIKPLCNPDGSKFCIDSYPARNVEVPVAISGQIANNVPVWVGSLQDNKQKLAAACQAAGVPAAHQALMVAMAMQETTNMDVKQRDATKDCATDGSANLTIFNLSVDLVERTGYYGKNTKLTYQQWQMLNSESDQARTEAVRILESAFQQWGVLSTLAYVRGGYYGWKNADSDPDVQQYYQSIAAILSYIDQDPSLLTDGRRVEVYLKHI